MIGFHSFVFFCKGLVGKILPTADGRAKFKLTLVQNGCLSYTPLSTRKIRHDDKNCIERVLAHYAASKSLRPKDYTNITVNASYILTLIKLYIDSINLVFLNGKLLSLGEARVSPRDYGYLYGYGLYETMRSYNGSVFRLEDHLQRLEEVASLLGMQGIPSRDWLRSAVHLTLAANSLVSARIRLTLSAGEGSLVPDLKSCKQPAVIIFCTEYQPTCLQTHRQMAEERYLRGYSAIFSSIIRNSKSPLVCFKSANTLECMLARQEARDKGTDEAVFLNEQGQVAEGSSTNIFIASGGKLLTPDEDTGILAGITRKVVFEIAGQKGIEVLSRKLYRDDLCRADEAFLTNSIIEIMPLTAVNGRAIGNGKAGALTLKLMQAYRQLVQAETQG